jgi:hypothetical protein
VIIADGNDLHLDSLAPELRDLVLTAAVRERFQPSALLSDWMERQAPNVPTTLLDDALGVTLSLGAALGGVAETPAGGELPLEIRRQILGEADIQVVRKAVKRAKPRTQVERSFAALAAGKIPDPNGMTRGDLLALATAAAWAEGLNGVAPLSAAAVQRRLRDQEFVERVGGGDLSLFVGRGTLLNALCRLWVLPARPVVLIEGPGGIGKSIAVARFFQMLLSGERGLKRPDAILHLDFDLPALQRSNEMGLAAEIVRQLALRWTTGSADRLLSLLRGLGGDHDSFEGIRGETFQTSLRDNRTWETPEGVLREALTRFVPESVGPPRLVLFADSFERAERLDEVVADNVRRAFEAIRNAGADVMVIYAGRAFRNPNALDPQHRPSLQRVRRFRQGEAVNYLTGKARQRGIRLQRHDADRANRVLGGWPLGLRIAVSMLGSSPETFKASNWLAAIESGEGAVEATLYERLLNRIKDTDLQKLAKPGLLVRRLTGQVIERVLAAPCGLPTDADGKAILRRAEMEGQLFARDVADPDALWHRQDLREVMLPVLRQEVDPETARAIHDGAVDFYANQSGDIARAEELYHRLCRGDGPSTIAARWLPIAGRRLVSALEDLPPQATSLLRQFLGGGRSDASSAESDVRLEELRSVARNRLADGATDLSDLFTLAEVPEEIFSPLGDIQAEVLARLGRYQEVLDASQEISTAAGVPPPVKARVAITAAGLAEGLNDPWQALHLWREAMRLKRYLQPLERLTIHTGMARVLREISAPRSTRRYHVAAACRLLEMNVGAVRSNRVLRLESVAELSDIFRPARNHRGPDQWEQIRAILMTLFRGLRPMFPSASSDRSRLDEIAEILRLDPKRIQSPYELDKIMPTLYANPAAGQHETALSALRSEVDYSFASVVKRSPFGNEPHGLDPSDAMPPSSSLAYD